MLSAVLALGLEPSAAVPAVEESALRTERTVDKSADLLAEKRAAVAMPSAECLCEKYQLIAQLKVLYSIRSKAGTDKGRLDAVAENNSTSYPKLNIRHKAFTGILET